MIRCSWRTRFENFAEHRMHECGECGVCHGETHTWNTLQEFVRKGEIHRGTVEKFSRCNMFLAGSTLQIISEKPDKTWKVNPPLCLTALQHLISEVSLLRKKALLNAAPTRESMPLVYVEFELLFEL